MIWHRKARKTYTAIVEVLKQAHLRKGIYWIIFPTKAEGKDAVWRDPLMLFDVIHPNLILKTNETELVVYLKCGSIIQLKGSDDPDSLRGPNPCGVVFDEWDTQKAGGWEVVEPILRSNSGFSWFIGTPRGKSKLYDFYNRGQSGHHEWGSSLLRADISGIIASDQLAEARKSMTEQMYRQEMLCEFLEAQGSVFRGVKDIMISVPQDPTRPENQQKLYVMGVDLAKVQDYTTIRVYDRETNSLVYSDRFQTLEWPFQRRRIAATATRFNKALTIIDATGLGDPIADDLIRAGVSVLPFKITEQTKKDIIEKLSIYIEQKRIKLLPSQEALLEYENFSYEMGPTGKIRYGARPGYHDDIVCFVKGTQILTNKGQIPIEQVKIGDMVMTRKGYQPVINTMSSIKKVITNTKLGLTGTPDHPIITTKGNKSLAKVSDSDTIYIWNEKLLSIKVKNGVWKIQSLINKCGSIMERNTDTREERVYNLTVANQPEYFANNVLVHNCGDALAVWHLSPLTIPEFTKEPTRIQTHYAKMVNRYENAKNNDNEDGDPFNNEHTASEWGDMPNEQYF